MANRRPTLRDVARLAGVSHMTVSRVVRGGGGVSEPVRAKVEAAIGGLGYRPDPALAALAAYRTRSGGGAGSVLAFLECEDVAYSRLVFSGVQAEAERLGYAVAAIRLPRRLSAQVRLGKVLFHRGVRGLLFGPSQSPWTFGEWAWDEFAPVSLGVFSHEPPMHGVAMDYFDGMERAVAFLRDRGATRIGLAVEAELEARTGHRWLGGYLSHAPKVFPRFAGAAGDGTALERWQRKHRLDGILTIHSAVWRALAGKAGVVFLNAFDCPRDAPRITLDPRRIGQEGVRTVHHRILNREFGLPREPQTIALRGRIAWGLAEGAA